MPSRTLALAAAALAVALALVPPVPAAGEDALRVADWGPRDVVTTRFPVLFARFAEEDVPALARVLVDGVELDANVTGNFARHVPAAPLEPGPHRAWIRAEDAHGRAAEVAWSFVVVPQDVEGEAAFALARLAPARAVAALDVADLALGIANVEAVPATDARNLTVSFERLASFPPSVAPLWLAPLLLLDSRAVADAPVSFESVSLRFSLPASALEAFDAEPRALVPLGYVEGRWRVLETDKLDDTERATVVARTMGFHPFALVADVQSPVVEALSPRDGEMLRAPPTLRASATDNVQLERAALTVDSVLVRATETRSEEVGRSTIQLEALLPDLSDGRHTVDLRAFDGAENLATRAWTFILDRSPPTFPTAAPPVVARGATAPIDVALSDAISGVDPARVTVWLDGANVTRDAIVDALVVRYSPPSGLASGEHVLVVIAADRAGNEATLTQPFHVAAATPGPGAFVVALGAAVAAALTGTVRGRTPPRGGPPRP